MLIIAPTSYSPYTSVLGMGDIGFLAYDYCHEQTIITIIVYLLKVLYTL